MTDFITTKIDIVPKAVQLANFRIVVQSHAVEIASISFDREKQYIKGQRVDNRICFDVVDLDLEPFCDEIPEIEIIGRFDDGSISPVHSYLESLPETESKKHDKDEKFLEFLKSMSGLNPNKPISMNDDLEELHQQILNGLKRRQQRDN